MSAELLRDIDRLARERDAALAERDAARDQLARFARRYSGAIGGVLEQLAHRPELEHTTHRAA